MKSIAQELGKTLWKKKSCHMGYFLFAMVYCISHVRGCNKVPADGTDAAKDFFVCTNPWISFSFLKIVHENISMHAGLKRPSQHFLVNIY